MTSFIIHSADKLRNMGESASILAYLGFSGLIKLSVNYLWRNRRPDNLEKAGHVTALYLYPVKSGKGISLQKIQVSAQTAAHSGPLSDRQFTVIKDDVVITAKDTPQLVKLEAKFEDGRFVIMSPHKKSVTVDPGAVDEAGICVSARVVAFGKTVHVFTGLDCGDEVAQLISDYLGRPGYRMLYCSPTINQRKTKLQDVFGIVPPFKPFYDEAEDDDTILFQNITSLSMCTEESLADLRKRMDKPVNTERFRLNIIVSSGLEPYSEDTWKEVFIGDVRLTGIIMMERCPIVNVDPETCETGNIQPLNALRSYRPLGLLGPCFGLSLVVKRPGTINVGDPIYVTRGPALTYISNK